MKDWMWGMVIFLVVFIGVPILIEITDLRDVDKAYFFGLFVGFCIAWILAEHKKTKRKR